MKTLYTSDRLFTIWTYSISHNRLLLRSTGDEGPGTRVDVLFSQIERMLLRPVYHGLAIREAEPDEVPHFRDRYGDPRERARVFLLAPDLDDFVVADWVQWHEGDDTADGRSFYGHFYGSTALEPGG